MRSKQKPVQKSALEIFEAEKAAILALVAKLAPMISEYDAEISAAPGGHENYSHAGTLAAVRTELEQVVSALNSARENTRTQNRVLRWSEPNKRVEWK